MSAMLPRSIALLLLVVLPLTRVATAWGEETPVDTAAVETGLIKKITPVYSGSIRGNASRLTMGNRFSNTLLFSNGLTMTTTIRADESKYRDQDRADNTKEMSHTMMKMLKPGLLVNGLLSDNRVDNRIVTFTGAVQNFIVENKRAHVNAQYSKSVKEGFGVNGTSSIAVSSSKQNFKKDRSLDGSIGGGINYELGDRITARVRGYLYKSDDRSEAGSLNYKGLGASEDSLRSTVSVQVTDSSRIGFEYVRYNKTRDYIDLPRGVFFEQDLQAVDLIAEKELRNTRMMRVSANTKPIHGFSIKMTARHSEQTTDFAKEKRRTGKNVSDILSGTLVYNLGEKTKADFKLERKKVFHDQGGQPLSSYNEVQQSVRATLRHAFTKTLSLNLVANTSLSQSKYVYSDVNPRDWDRLNQNINLNLRSSPFPKVSTSIVLSVTSVEFVNIDASLSGDNRKETTYDLRPSITYRLSDRIQIQQEYNLNVEFTDFVFTDEDNFLDRNIRFTNQVTAQLSGSINVEFYYTLHLHDGGSYLREYPGAERLLAIDSEDRKDQTRIKMRYTITKNLTALCEQEYNRRIDRIVATGQETEFTDGGIRGGLMGNYKWGNNQSVTFTLMKANRFGRFNSDAQNDYWEMDTQVKYNF